MEGTDFRVAATETLVQAQSKERIAELVGVDPNAATRKPTRSSPRQVKADAEVTAAASKAAAEKEEEDAALKIQAVFRGKAARRDVEELKKGGESRSARTEAAAAAAAAPSRRAPTPSRGHRVQGCAARAPAAQLGHWEVFAARQIARHVPSLGGQGSEPRRGGIGSGPRGRGVPVRPRVAAFATEGTRWRPR